MAQPPEASFTLYSFFGSADDRRFQDLTRRTFDLFRCPMLKIQIRLKDDWHIHSLRPLSLDDLRDARAGIATAAAFTVPNGRPGVMPGA